MEEGTEFIERFTHPGELTPMTDVHQLLPRLDALR